MRLIILNILTLLLLVSCSDSSRIRSPKSKDNVPLSNADESLRTNDFEFTKLFIAEIFVPIKVASNTITIEDDMIDIDHDQTFSCTIQVAKGTQFRFVADDYKLKLSNQTGVMNFTKTNGFMGEGIHGTWEMVELVNANHIITEVEFNHGIYMRLRKTCKIR